MNNITTNESSATVVSIHSRSEQDKTINSTTGDEKRPVIECKAKRRVLIFGFALTSVSSTFTGSSMGSAVGKIASNFNDFENMSWYLTGFLLCSGVMQLLSKRISDCLGRRRVYIFGLTLMMVTNILCAVSANSNMFISVRIFQGISAGICQILSSTVIIDLFPLEQRIKYQSNSYIAYGFSSSAGPFVGGVFAEMPTKPEQKLSVENAKTLFSRIDATGCIISSISIVGFLLSMNFGSASLRYSWSSPIVIGLLVGSSIVGILFIIYERFMAAMPLFPSKIIANKDMALIYIQQFINGVYYVYQNLISIVTFQSVYNDTSTSSSLKILPATISFICFTLLQNKITKKLKTSQPTMIVGNFVILLSTLLMSFVETVHSNLGVQISFPMLFSIGLGLVTQASQIASQLILEKKAPQMVATSISLTRFLVQLGLTVGTAIFLSTLKVEIARNLVPIRQMQPAVYQSIIEAGTNSDYVKVRLVQDELIRTTLNSIYLKSISVCLYSLISMSIIALLCSIFVKIPKLPQSDGEEKVSISSG